MNIPEKMIPVEEVGRLKGITSEKVMEMIRDGFYVGQIVGEDWFISESELQLKDAKQTAHERFTRSVSFNSTKLWIIAGIMGLLNTALWYSPWAGIFAALPFIVLAIQARKMMLTNNSGIFFLKGACIGAFLAVLMSMCAAIYGHITEWRDFIGLGLFALFTPVIALVFAIIGFYMSKNSHDKR